MKRLLTADPCFWAILDAESRLLGCSSPALIRCGTLDLIAKNNQARIPLFFKEERELKLYLDTLHRFHRDFNSDNSDLVLKDLVESAPDDLRQRLLDTIYSLFESEREKIFRRSKLNSKTILKP